MLDDDHDKDKAMSDGDSILGFPIEYTNLDDGVGEIILLDWNMVVESGSDIENMILKSIRAFYTDRLNDGMAFGL